MIHKNEEQEWFCVKSKPNQEQLAATNLALIRDSEVFLPKVSRTSKRYPKSKLTEPLFPGYLFLKADLSQEYQTVRHTIGVSNLVSFGAYRPTLSQKMIQDLRSFEQAYQRNIDAKATIKNNSKVQLLIDCFKDSVEGHVVELLPKKDRVKVLISFMSRQLELTVPTDNIRAEA